MIILGVITLLLSGAAIVFYDSPIGWDEYFYMGLVAGAGWLVGGLIFHRRLAIMALYVVCTVAAVLALVPFMQQTWFHFRPQEGDLYAAVYRLVEDDRLTWRVQPNAWGHDANGFRNPRVPSEVDFVTIGDSQTWGINVRREETWPYVLADLSGQRVYSMALGGYGPVEYWVLTGDALAQFAPDVVVVGVYLGNDLYDAYQSIYLRDTFARFRDPAVAVHPDISFDKRTDGTYDGEPIHTAFTITYRLAALDLDVDHVAEGLRLSKVMLGAIGQQTRTANVRLVVLLIPTKETTYADLVPAPLPPAYQRLVDMETRVRGDLIAFFETNQIEYVDSLPALAETLRNGQAVYLSDADGHFNARGCAILAAAVYKYLAN
jgi:hypothetical protein